MPRPYRKAPLGAIRTLKEIKQIMKGDGVVYEVALGLNPVKLIIKGLSGSKLFVSSDDYDYGDIQWLMAEDRNIPINQHNDSFLFKNYWHAHAFKVKLDQSKSSKAVPE